MTSIVGHRLVRYTGPLSPAPSFAVPPSSAGTPRQVAGGGPVDGTTWTVTVTGMPGADGPELVTSIQPFRERPRPGGSFAAPVVDPRTPLHIGTGRTDDLPPWVLVRAVADVVSVVTYGTSGRRYDLGLTGIDAELGVRFGAVLLNTDDAVAHVVARLADGRSIVAGPPWGLLDHYVTADPEPVVASRDVHRRALTAAGATAAGPEGSLAALRALAHGPREPRERAAEVLCAHLRAPVDKTDPAVRRRVQTILTTWVRAAVTRLDLVGADLVDLDLSGCRLDDVDFSAATFRGDTRFDGATFPHHARFAAATFQGDAHLAGARVGGTAEFDHAAFRAHADLDRIVVGGDAVFTAATFRADATIVDATVGGRSSLDHAVVRGVVDGTRARFGNGIDLDDTDVNGHALFPEATFVGPVELATARVRGQVVLDGARAGAHEGRARRWPSGWTLAPAVGADGYRRLR